MCWCFTRQIMTMSNPTHITDFDVIFILFQLKVPRKISGRNEKPFETNNKIICK